MSKCETCKYFEFKGIKAYKSWGNCSGVGQEVEAVFADNVCPNYRADKKKSVSDAMIKIGESIRLGWGR